MTEEELKEQFRQKLINTIKAVRADMPGFGIQWQELAILDREVEGYFSWFKQAGYVQLDEDQNLPPIDKITHSRYWFTPYELAQQDMLKAGFKKVK